MDKTNCAIAKGNLIRTSPRKLNLVAGLIRGSKAGKALTQLSMSKRRVAGDVKKVLMAAIANAENNNGMDVDKLYVSEAFVGKAITMKRFRARAKGRGARIIKMFSNITIVLKEQMPVAEKKDKKENKKETNLKEKK